MQYLKSHGNNVLCECNAGSAPDASSFELITKHVHTCLLICKDKHVSSVYELCNVAHQPLLLRHIPSNNLDNLNTGVMFTRLLECNCFSDVASRLCNYKALVENLDDLQAPATPCSSRHSDLPAVCLDLQLQPLQL